VILNQKTILKQEHEYWNSRWQLPVVFGKHYLGEAVLIYMLVYEVVKLMCSFSDDLMTPTLKVCAIFLCANVKIKVLQTSPMSIWRKSVST